MISAHRVLIASSIVAAVGLPERMVRADPDDDATSQPPDSQHDQDERQAQALAAFQAGRELMRQKRYEEACGEFARSQELDPGVGTILNLGYCYEKLGRTAGAWAAYREAADAARAAGKTDWEKSARARVAHLENSLLPVVIDVQPQTAGDPVSVVLDGSVFPKTMWGQRVPLYPGQHEVRAKAVDKRVWTTTFEVDAEHLPTVTVPVLQAISPLPAASEAQDQRSGSPPHPGDPQRTAALVLGGAGVIALGVASILALSATATYHDADCGTLDGERACTRPGMDAISRAHAEWIGAEVAAPAGAAAIVGAAILWFTGSTTSTRIRIQATLEGERWIASLRGSW
jgi:hypothetical protein